MGKSKYCLRGVRRRAIDQRPGVANYSLSRETKRKQATRKKTRAEAAKHTTPHHRAKLLNATADQRPRASTSGGQRARGKGSVREGPSPACHPVRPDPPRPVHRPGRTCPERSSILIRARQATKPKTATPQPTTQHTGGHTKAKQAA
jgi:hypothetical protein